tara:strand:+ start:1112 stop:2665 length:1554 start_codon:yes stop_codon:yes gene_type:complete
MKSTELEKLYNNPNLPKSINDCIKNVMDEDEDYAADELVDLSERILLELASVGISIYLSQKNQKDVYNDFILDLFTSKSHSYNAGPLYRWSAYMVKDVNNTLSKEILSLYWNKSNNTVLNNDFERLSELRNAVMHGFFVLPAERNMLEANHIAKVLDQLIKKDLFKIQSKYSFHFIEKNNDISNFIGEWDIENDNWQLYKDCFDFGKLTTRIQYEKSEEYENDQKQLIEKNINSKNNVSEILDFLDTNEKGAISFLTNPQQDTIDFYSLIVNSLENNKKFFIVYQKLEHIGINFTSDFLLNRIIKKLSIHVSDDNYSKNNKKALVQLRKKCKIKPVVIIDSIHISLFNNNHILHLADLFYENNILLIGFGINHSWMNQFFNKSINNSLQKSPFKAPEWKEVFKNYLRYKGPNIDIENEKDDYEKLVNITTNIIKELDANKIVIARRFSDKNNYPMEIVHEAFSILEPFYKISNDKFERDQVDKLYEFPKEITESSRILFSIGRRDIEFEYQHKTLKL